MIKRVKCEISGDLGSGRENIHVHRTGRACSQNSRLLLELKGENARWLIQNNTPETQSAPLLTHRHMHDRLCKAPVQE